MKKYSEERDNRCIKANCNKCGREIKTRNGLIIDAALSIDYNWGYFSDFDGETHSFDICHECYKRMIEDFVIPVEKKETTELL